MTTVEKSTAVAVVVVVVAEQRGTARDTTATKRHPDPHATETDQPGMTSTPVRRHPGDGITTSRRAKRAAATVVERHRVTAVAVMPSLPEAAVAAEVRLRAITEETSLIRPRPLGGITTSSSVTVE